MFGFKILAVAALACVAVAHDTPHDTACVAPVTVTVTETVCGQPGVPVHTPPVAPSNVMPPPGHPITSVESTATAPLQGPPSETATVVPPAPPAETGVPSVGIPPVVPSSGVKSSAASVPGTTTVPSSTAGVTGPPPSSSAPETVSTAGAVLAIPYRGLGSLIAVGAAFNAAMAVIV